MKKLHPATRKALEQATSIYQPKGFHSTEDIRKFWFLRHGASGFLNIKEVTPQMVQEIRTLIPNPKRAS
jgi:hypothetical protein